MSEEEPRIINPFKIINRGEDTLSGNDETVIFADFSPRVLPADTPEEVVEVAPKDAFAPGLVRSSELAPTSALSTSATLVPTVVERGDGTPKLNDDSKQSFSSDQNPGQSEQLV